MNSELALICCSQGLALYRRRQKGDKAHVQRSVAALLALDSFEDKSTYEATPAFDGRRLAMFLAASKKEEREALALTLVEQHNWLQRAQRLRAVGQGNRSLSRAFAVAEGHKVRRASSF